MSPASLRPNHLRRLLARTGGYDLWVIGSLLLLTGGAWGFLRLADAVLGGETRWFDEPILRGLRRPESPAVPIGPHWLLGAMRDLTALGGVTVLTLAVLSVVGFLLISRRWHAALFLALATSSGAFLTTGLKRYFDRPRPAVVPHLVPVSSASFPSGHSLNSALVYLMLGTLLARLAPSLRLKAYVIALACLLTALVGASRVYLGVHYPTDVLGGWTLGLGWALAWGLAARWLQRRGMVESSAENRPV